MLRVRPILFTPSFEDTVAQLRQLGLACVENDGDRAVLDTGNGKVGVCRQSPDHRGTLLAFELRDPAIFVRRTLADGTHAELAETPTGPGARVNAPDGFSFELAASNDLRVPDPGAPLAVVVTWRTPNPTAANKVLADIGAKFVQDRADGGALFWAKNGGFVATAAGGSSGVELGIMRDGEHLPLGCGGESGPL